MKCCRMCGWFAPLLALLLGLLVPWLAKGSIDSALADSASTALAAQGIAGVAAHSDWGRLVLTGPPDLEAPALAAAQGWPNRSDYHSVTYVAQGPAAAPVAPPPVASAPASAATETAIASAVLATPVKDADDLQARLRDLLGRTTIQFATGSARIDPGSTAKLDAAAALIPQVPSAHVLIEGHTDARGSADRNLALSQQRAEAVQAYLRGKGVPAAQLATQGFGATRPLESNDTPEGRAANRRISFTVRKG